LQSFYIHHLLLIQENQHPVFNSANTSNKIPIWGIRNQWRRLNLITIDSDNLSHPVNQLTNPRLTPLEFLRTLAFRLEIEHPAEYKSELLEQLGGRLYQLYRDGIHPVLIIDEAQLIPHKDTFDEIRLLTNFQLDDGNLLSVVLMGQPELRIRLAHPVYEPLRQRIGIHFDLGPLDEEEASAYLQHRIRCAGGQENIFLPDAIKDIVRFTGGIPRKINQVAALALLEGFGRGRTQIDAEIVDEVVAELKEL